MLARKISKPTGHIHKVVAPVRFGSRERVKIFEGDLIRGYRQTWANRLPDKGIRIPDRFGEYSDE